MEDGIEDENPGSPKRRRRSKKACHRCHARKIRCDVQEKEQGVPCTNCAEQSETCTIRRRKNQRAPLIMRPGETGPVSFNSPNALWPENDIATGTTYSGNTDNAFNQSPSTANPSGAGCSGFDFTTLTALDDIFNVGYNDSVLPFTAVDIHNLEQYDLGIGDDHCPSALAQVSFLDPSHQQFLYRQGCLALPSATLLRQMMELYFNHIHPNLPLLDESKIWSLWQGDVFELSDFSYLLLRAILFSVAHFLEPEALSEMGFATKLEARQSYYKQAKLLFESGIDHDPVANAQACLLLTYYAPNYNVLRVNSYWLVNGVRYAKIARANVFHLIEDREQATILKRLWWCVLFRDRILSLCLRQPLNVELDPFLSEDRHILREQDFRTEMGQSQVHSQETQLRLVEIITATCRLVRCLTPALLILYHSERIDQRITVASTTFSLLTGIARSLEKLYAWHNDIIGSFPSPVALDDATGSVCILANMLFCYYSTAVFALNAHRLLLNEMSLHSETNQASDEAAKALEPAMEDVSARMQEVLQLRLAPYLPISASAVIALPLILQAINVTAARGFEIPERVQARRLEILTRTLQIQRQHFEGSDAISDILSNIVAYAKDDKFLTSMAGWRDDRDATLKRGYNKTSFQWPEMVRKCPRLFLRILLKLDRMLCSGAIAAEDDCPSVLRRGTK